MAAQVPDAKAVIEKWLSASSAKVEKFWEAVEGSDWSAWVRYELFLALDAAFGKEALVLYEERIWDNDGDAVDVSVIPRAENSNPVFVKLRCERVYGNAGNFEEWAEEMDQDFAKIKELGQPREYESGTILLVGFSEMPPPPEVQEASGEDLFKTKPEPKSFSSGNVYGWIMEYDIAA